ncbi:MAG: LysR family transcriptional regulator [Qingshengfaniella sp.]
MTTIPEGSRLSLKQIRAICAISDTRRVAHAAEALNTSQSAVSRALAGAEDTLGATLFQRGWSGTEPTSLGEVVIGRCHRILDRIERAEQQLFADKPPGYLAARLSWIHLETLDAVIRNGSTKAAAAVLSISQPMVSRTLTQLGAFLGQPVFARRAHGLDPTELALALNALWDAVDRDLAALPSDLRGASAGLMGRMAVGMLPFSGQDLAIRALSILSQQHPRLRLTAIPGSYLSLVQALKRREIDVIMGILRGEAVSPDLKEETLYNEIFAFIARHDHPCHSQLLGIRDLKRWTCTVAPHGTPIRRYFERLFSDAGELPPAQTCEILSFANAEQMIVEGQSIALLSYSEKRLSQLRPELRQVALDLPEAPAPIGLTSLRNQHEEPATEQFRAALIRCVAEAGLAG